MSGRGSYIQHTEATERSHKVDRNGWSVMSTLLSEGLRSWEVLSWSRNTLHSMETEGSLPHSQTTATCSYTKPEQSSSCTSFPKAVDSAAYAQNVPELLTMWESEVVDRYEK